MLYISWRGVKQYCIEEDNNEAEKRISIKTHKTCVDVITGLNDIYWQCSR